MTTQQEIDATLQKNGHIVMKAMNTIHEPVTLIRLVKRISEQHNLIPNQIKTSVKAVLQTGLDSGFIIKSNGRYSVCGRDHINDWNNVDDTNNSIWSNNNNNNNGRYSLYDVDNNDNNINNINNILDDDDDDDDAHNNSSSNEEVDACCPPKKKRRKKSCASRPLKPHRSRQSSHPQPCCQRPRKRRRPRPSPCCKKPRNK